MRDYQAGMIVRQKAIDWWPYIGTLIERINKAADTMNTEVLDEIFLDAAKIVEKGRKVATVGEIRNQLENELTDYKGMVKDIARMNSIINTGIGTRGKPVTESTLKQYRSDVFWKKSCLNERKEVMQKLAKTIKGTSTRGGKIISRGGVSLRLIHVGNFPAKLEREYSSGWQTVR